MNAQISRFTKKFAPFFWSTFILLPMLTGWFHYNYLPNEDPYDSRFEIVKSPATGVGTERLQSADVPDIWRDKVTDNEHSSEQFSSHQTQEAWRVASTAFAYGLICCVDSAVTYAKGEKRFLYGLGNALLVNMAVSAIFHVTT